MSKPKVFIASSSESLPITRAIVSNLDYDYEITAWNGGTFTLSSTTIDDLVKKSSTTDFAIFVFQPDDLSTSRGSVDRVVRDNVLFELGLFIGAIGVSRCLIVKPRNVDLKLPSDLLGLTMADYDSERSDNNYESALTKACHQMDVAMKAQGGLDRKALLSTEKLIANPAEYKLGNAALKVLINCLETHTSSPDGKRFHMIAHELKELDEGVIRVQLIKLERMSLVEKAITVSNYNEDDIFYSYKITDAGIDCVLENETVRN